MAAKKQITIKQVAHEAGVSIQTVSRVFNDHPDVAPETRRRVKELIVRLGYQPNVIARSLIKQRSHTLGAVIAGLDQYGPQRMLMGIEQYADELGYSLLLRLVHQPELDPSERLLQELLARQVDGIIWAVPEVGNNLTWLQDKLPHFSAPLIFAGGRPQPGFPVISIDNRQGGCLAVEHLLAQGYRQIGLITGPMGWWAAQQRQLGWQDALLAAGLTPTERQVVQGDWSAASGEVALRHLLAQYPEIEAVFASNDQMALGVLQAAHQLGRRVPEDLAVVGFDNIPESAYFWPPLTTVRQRLLDLGRMAVQELHRMIEAGRQDEVEPQAEEAPPATVVLQPQLIVRKSSVVL